MNIALQILLILISALVSAFIALIITIFFQEKFIKFFLFKFGKLPTKPQRKITGIWYSVFWFVNVDNKVTFKQNILKIVGLWNSYSGRTIIGADHQIKVYGSTKIDTYVTGKWEHIDTDNYYHGSFQFIIDPEGDRAHGRWLGFNKKNVVATGPWILVRILNENSNYSDIELKNKYSKNGIIQFNLLPDQIKKIVTSIIKQQNSKEIYASWRKIDNSNFKLT